MPAPSGFDHVSTTKSSSTRSIAAHPCKERKDGAPSAGMGHAKIVKGGPAASNSRQSADASSNGIPGFEKRETWATRQAYISKDGTIENLQLISGHPMLVPAAIDAVKQWVYHPYALNNRPVDVETQIQVNFTLSNN
jgi:hypothetical protein